MKKILFVILALSLSSSACTEVAKLKTGKTNVSQAEHCLIQGNNSYLAKDYQQAITHYEKALKIDLNYAMAYSNLGNVYNKLGQYEQAIAHFEKVLQIDPNYAMAYSSIGATYNKLGQYQQAITSFEKALQMDPNDVAAYVGFGSAYSKLDQHQQAITHFEKALQIDPNHTTANYNLGIIYAQLDQHQQAITHFEKVLEIDPDYVLAYDKLGLSYNSLNQYKQAVTYSQKAIQIDPNRAVPYYNLGVSYSSMMQHQQAIAYFQKSIEIDPNFALPYSGIGAVYLTLGEPLQAKHYFQKAKDLYSAQGDHDIAQGTQEIIDMFPSETADNLYTDNQLGFSMKLPEGWKNDGGALSAYTSEATVRLMDEQETMFIDIMKSPVYRNFREEVESSISSLNPVSEDWNEINLSGYAGLKITLQIKYYNEKAKALLYFFNTPKATYMITATPLNPKDFNMLKPLLEKISESITIIETE